VHALRLFFRLIANLLTLLLWPLIALVRRGRMRQRRIVHVVIDGSLALVQRRGLPWQRTRAVALDALARTFDNASRDPRVDVVLISLRRLGGGGATACSLRDLIVRLRARGKRVVVYLPNGASGPSGTTSHELYVAASASELILGRASSIGPLGFTVEQPYFATALGRLGVEAEVLAHGRFKTAGEQLLRSSMSAPQREQVEALLSDAATELVTALASGRGVPEAEARRWLDLGPCSAERAQTHGLADAVLYDDELSEHLLPGASAGLLPWAHYERHCKPLLRSLRPEPLLAVIEVSGVIVGRAAPGLPSAAEPSLRQALKRARDDRRVLGVLLAINSRGGSALASERLLREVQLTARVKPVVAYLADVAASGGYMIAAGSACIVAQPLSLTGSIGVVSGRLLISGLLEQLGVAVEVVKRGEHADMFSGLRPLGEAERRALLAQLEELYVRFVRLVADGRGRAPEEIEAVAEGRVWSGRAALANGLVDRLGGPDVALEELRSRVGTAGGRALPMLLGARRLPRLGLGSSGADGIASLLPGLVPSAWLDLATLALAARDEFGWFWSSTALGGGVGGPSGAAQK
jgi:protease-4